MGRSIPISKEGDVVGVIDQDGHIRTNDPTLLSMVGLGVVTRGGGTVRGEQGALLAEDYHLVGPSSSRYIEELVTVLLDNGYTVPSWLLQSLA